MSTSRIRNRLETPWVLLVTVAAGCVGLAELGHLISFPGNFATFWPNAGFVLGMLVHQPVRRWGWVLCGSLLANLISDVGFHHKTVVVASGFWLSNSAETLVAIWLIRRLSHDGFALDTVRRVLQFVFIPCFLSTFVGAIFGAFVVWAAFGGDYGTILQVWWSGDFIGMLVFFPLLQQALSLQGLPLVNGDVQHVSGARARAAIRFVSLLLVHLMVTHYIFGEQHERLAYAVFPTLLWTVIRFEQTGANICLLLSAVIIVANTAFGRGLFGEIPDIAARARVVQVFLFVSSVTFLSLAAAMRERRLSERGLFRSQATIEQAPYAVFWVTQDGQLQYVNKRATAMLGYSSDILMNLSLGQFCGSDALSTWESYLQQPEERHQVQFEGYLRHFNGTMLDCEFRLSSIDFDAERMVVATVSDIAERKAAVRDLVSTKQQLEAYISLIGTTDGSWSWTIKTGEMQFTSRHREILGYPASDRGLFPDTFTAFLLLFHPQDRAEFRQHLADHFVSNEVFENEYRLRLLNGDFRWFRIRANTTRDATGEPETMAGSTFDVTARKKAELQLKRSNTDLEQFAYVASHDLQEPLRAISGFCQLLKTRYAQSLDDKGRGYIQNAVDGVARMSTLISDLLEFSRIGRNEDAFRTVPLEEVVESTMRDLNELIAERQAVVEVRRPLPQIWGDAGMLGQLFQNLLSNAIKFCTDDTVPVIEIAGDRDGLVWRIIVSDNGCGIPPEYQERIFTIFKRLHRREEVQGTGIGLAICKRIVDRHTGKIWVESAVGGGSRFVLQFPIRESNDV